MIGKGLTGLAGMLALLTVTMAVLSKLKPADVIKNVLQLLPLVLTIILLTVPLIALGSMPWDTMMQGLAGLGIMIAGLLVALAGIAAISKMGGSGLLTGILSIVALAAAVLLLTPALIALSLVPIVSLVKAILAIAVTFAVLGVAAALLQPIIPAILALAASMLALGVGILAASLGMTMLGVGFVLVASGISALVSALVLAGKSLEIITVAIVEIIVALAEGLGKGIIIIIQTLADSMPIIADFLRSLVETLCVVLVECIPQLVNALLELVQALLDAIVEYLPNILKSLFDIILILLDGLIDLVGPLIDRVIGFLIAIIEGVARNLEPIIVAIVDLFTALIGGIVSALASLDFSGDLTTALLNISMLALIALELAAVTLLAPAAMFGVLALGALVTELSIVLAALGALSQIPGLTWLVDRGGDLLQSVGTAIGKFVGGIIGGIGAGIADQLPGIAEDLSEFMKLITPFVDGAKKIDRTALDGVGNLVEMVLLITGARLIDGIASFLLGGSSMTDFAKEIEYLGLGLKNFSDSVSGTVVTNVTTGAQAAKELAGLYDILPNIGGIASLFAGEQSMTLFAAELPLLGLGLLGFSKAVDGMNVEAVNAGANAVVALAGIYDYLPNIGGIVSLFTGEQSMTLFAAELPLLGVGLLGFSKAVDGINAVAVQAATDAAIALAGMYDYLPKIGGIVSLWEGENTLSLFALELPLLGAGLLGFSKAVDGISPTEVMAAADAAVYLAQVADALPTTGGVFSWFSGSTDWDGFRNNIPKVGKAIKGFSDAVDGVIPETITAAADAALSLAKVAEALPTTGGLFDWATSDTDWEGFKNNIPKVGEAIKSFSTKVAGITPENVTAGANAAKALAEMADVVPKDTDKIIKFGENLTNFGTSLKSYFKTTSGITEESVSMTGKVVDAVKSAAGIDASAAKSAATAIEKLTKAIKTTSGITGDSADGFCKALEKLASVSADAFVKSFEGITKKMMDLGKDAIDAFVKGISDSTKTAETAGEDLAEATAAATGDSVGMFETAGADLVEGFAAGISANSYLAEAKARAMAAAAATAAKRELDEHSPSKVGYGIGDYFGIAFVNAIADNVQGAYDASSEMAASAKHGLGDALRKIGDIVTGDIDAEPTIRPVLDLSNVESGVNKLGRMMDIGSSVGVLANIGAINAGMNRRGQNGSSDSANGGSGNITHNTYIIDGVTYDDGSNIALAMEEIVHAAKVERRT